MNKLNLIFKLGVKFLFKYFMQYIFLLKRPFLVALIGALVLFAALFNPSIAIFSLFIIIPCICYAFWQGYLITYSLNYAAYNFIKKEDDFSNLNDFLPLVKKEEKELAFFVSKSALVMIIIHIPLIIFVLKLVLASGLDFSSFTNSLPSLLKAFIVNEIIAFPFLNYFNQAFFFRKKGEKFISLFLNCYKKLNLNGCIIGIIITFLGYIIGIDIFLYIILVFPLNLLSSSINTFWYSTRMKN